MSVLSPSQNWSDQSYWAHSSGPPGVGGGSSPQQSWLLPAVAGAMVGLPDIDLLAVGNGTIRFFDALSLLVLAMHYHRRGRLSRFSLAQRGFVYWLLASVVSTLLGVVSFGLPLLGSLFFVLRPVQYLYVGLVVAKYLSSAWERRIFFNFAFVGLVFSAAVDILQFSSISRLGVSFGGPFEFAAVAGGLLFAVFSRSLAKRHPAFVASVGTVLAGAIVLSAARVTLVAVLVAAVFVAARHVRVSLILLGAFLALLMPMLSPLMTGNNSSASNIFVVERFKSTELVESWRQGVAVSALVDTPRSFSEVQRQTVDLPRRILGEEQTDLSASIRFSRWIILVDGTFDSPRSAIFGNGAGSATAAVDGYFVRVFAETGFVGLALFLRFLYRQYFELRADYARRYFLIMILSSVFVDVFIAAKAMVLFWALTASSSE